MYPCIAQGETEEYISCGKDTHWVCAYWQYTYCIVSLYRARGNRGGVSTSSSKCPSTTGESGAPPVALLLGSWTRNSISSRSPIQLVWVGVHMKVTLSVLTVPGVGHEVHSPVLRLLAHSAYHPGLRRELAEALRGLSQTNISPPPL